MKMWGKFFLLIWMTLMLSSCLQNRDGEEPVILPEQNPPSPISIEEAMERSSFTISEPSVPFETTQEFATILNTNGKFDAVEITYENVDEGLTLVMLVTNSQTVTPPSGKKGLKLTNGAQTWEQGDDHVRAMYWRHEGLTYTLVTWQQYNGNQVPLYDQRELVEIANTIH